jgi:hypothetical protein
MQRNYNNRPPTVSSNSSFNSSLNRSGSSGQGNFFDQWQRNQPMDVRANNENVNYLNQMQIQNHLMNVGEVENRMKQNANIYNMLSQIQQRRRQTDFDKFLEKISNQNQNQRKYANGGYPQSVPFPNPQQMRPPMSMPPPPLTQVNINAILEKFRQMQNVPQGAGHYMGMPQRITPEELMLHTQKIMQNAILRKQNEKDDKKDPQV